MYDFGIAINCKRDTDVTALGLSAEELQLRTTGWGGNSPVTLTHYSYGQAVLTLLVRRAGYRHTVRQHKVTKILTERYTDCTFSLAPPLLQTSTFDVDVNLTFYFPEDANVKHDIEGPLSRNGGALVSPIHRAWRFRSKSNASKTFTLTDIAAGRYRWNAVAVGYGTYAGREFVIRPNEERLGLENRHDEYFEVTVGFSAPPAGNSMAVFLYSRGDMVASRSFKVRELGNDVHECGFIVQNGARTWASAQVMGGGQTVPVEIAPSAAYVRLGPWMDRHPCRFQVSNYEPGVLYWLSITHDPSEMKLLTHAFSRRELWETGLPEGTYRATLHTDSGSGSPVVFRVPESGTAIEMLR